MRSETRKRLEALELAVITSGSSVAFPEGFDELSPIEQMAWCHKRNVSFLHLPRCCMDMAFLWDRHSTVPVEVIERFVMWRIRLSELLEQGVPHSWELARAVDRRIALASDVESVMNRTTGYAHGLDWTGNQIARIARRLFRNYDTQQHGETSH